MGAGAAGGGGGGGAGGYAQMGRQAGGDILQAVAEIRNASKHKKLKYPGVTPAESRMRRMSMQDLQNARKTLYEGEGLYNQSLPMMYNAIPGVQAEMQYDPQAQQEYEQAYGQLSDRANLQDRLAAAQAERRGAKGKAAKKTARQSVRGLRREVKGAPKMAELERSVYGRISQGPKMKVSAKAPTQTDINSQNIQDELSNRTLAALRGETPNPTLEHNLTREQAHMQEQMMHQLGPDWQNSSAGIEAMNQFNQYANDQRDMSNRHDIEQMYQEQLGGQRAQFQRASSMQGLLANPSLGSVRMAQAGAGMSAAGVSAQMPYAADRANQFGVDTSNWNYGDPWSRGMLNSAQYLSSSGGSGGSSAPNSAPSGYNSPGSAQPDTVNVPQYGGYGS